jgi:surfactin synthase thioesterase subunit
MKVNNGINMQLNLFCFPFAGGTQFSLFFLKKYLDVDGIVLNPIEYAGHGTRCREPLFTDVHLLVEDIFNQIKDNLGTTYAFYGHSFGALVSFLLTHRIRECNLPLPQHLFVSGSQAPSTITNDSPYHTLPDDEFLKSVVSLGGIPDEILESPRIVQLYLSILKADFQAYETFSFVNKGKLNVPLTSIFGEDDIHYDKYIKDWQLESVYPAEFYYLPGNHFFIYEQGESLAKIIAGRLRENMHIADTGSQPINPIPQL